MGKVRVVYLVSADRSERSDYKSAISAAMSHVQRWYSDELNGATFLRYGEVEVVKATHNAAWFGESWGWWYGKSTYFSNVYRETNSLIGVKQNDPRYTWVIYCDAPGHDGRGGAGVCIMPEDDLLGLLGKHKDTRKNRWIGGLAHELGHALGLNHPADTTLYRDALMWTGYTKYPDTYFTGDDLQILGKSSFLYQGRAAKAGAGLSGLSGARGGVGGGLRARGAAGGGRGKRKRN